jgi:hypothetical protein
MMMVSVCMYHMGGWDTDTKFGRWEDNDEVVPKEI